MLFEHPGKVGRGGKGKIFSDSGGAAVGIAEEAFGLLHFLL